MLARVMILLALTGCGPEPSSSTAALESGRPIALVFHGKGASCEGGSCPEALAAMLRKSRFDFDVRIVGPYTNTPLTAELLAQATLYAQPGGEGGTQDAWSGVTSHLPNAAAKIRAFVANGGRYLGICMGGYLAGTGPGFGLLPGDAYGYVNSAGSLVHTEDDTIVPVNWNGAKREMFYQDGAAFDQDNEVEGARVFARYGTGNDGPIAALVAPYGNAGGRVAVTGPHPEADETWYEAAGLHDADGPDADLGLQLVDELMR